VLQQVKAIGQAHQSKVKEYIPNMYWALRNEDSNIIPEDARHRIEKDCFGIWSKRTLLDALPDEAKDPKRQKSGRLRQKEANFAALTAALPQQMIVVPFQETNEEDVESEVEDNNKIVVSNSTLSSLKETSYPLSPSLKNDGNGTIARLDFWFRLEDMRQYIQKSFNICKIKDRLWFNLTVNMASGVVLSASIGKPTLVSATSNGDENPNVRYY
jgi:hypothetical protein